ncbi:MAG TPA: hypothetical protein VFC84_06150 [Desulfosporosinus sp.]|nr:hypothetical protein [Desulfosporosinus sp.]
MKYKPQIETVLKRYKAFWQKDIYGRPPIRIRFPVPGEGEEEWTVACQRPETYFAYWENIFSQRAELEDDDVPSATVDLGPAFMAGVMGCPVQFGNGTSWSEHTMHDWDKLEELDKIPLDDCNPWVQRMKDLILYFNEKSKGKCAVGVSMLTGPGDIMTALRGPTQVCMDFYVYPEESKRLAEICTKAWIGVSQYQMNLITPLEGGFCDNYNIWTPGKSQYFAEDISTLVSPETYEEFLFPYDCQIADRLEVPWMHVHSAEARLTPEFVKIPGLRAIQIVNDGVAGPTLKEIVPLLKKIQEKHCLLLRKYTMEELEQVLPELSPKGLYIDTQCNSLDESKVILKDWNKRKFN